MWSVRGEAATANGRPRATGSGRGDRKDGKVSLVWIGDKWAAERVFQSSAGTDAAFYPTP